MNQQDWIEINAGGPGSGCNPDAGRCGRHPGSHPNAESITHTFKKAGDGVRGHTLQLKEGNKVVGEASAIHRGLGVVYIDSSFGVPKELRGKGYGKELYRRLIGEAFGLGMNKVQSEYKENRTDDATHVWESLKKEFTVKSFGSGGMQYFSIDVNDVDEDWLEEYQ